MAILVDAGTRVVCQGITGAQGTFHTEQSIAYGTRVVAGVTPGKGGSRHLYLPVYDRVADAVEATGADASAIYVPPEHAADAMLEAIHAGIEVVGGVRHRGSPGARHGARQACARRILHHPHRAEHPRHHHPRRMPDRHHAGAHPPPRAHRHRLALGHPHL